VKKQAKAKKEEGTGDLFPDPTAEVSARTESAVEARPKAKARTKKAAEVAEAAAPEAASATGTQAAPEETPAKPAKKAAAKKAAAKKAKPAAEVKEEPAEAVSAQPKAAKKAAKKATKKATKKDKGRDLVVDSPGAQEIAEVLHTPPPPVEEKPEEAALAEAKEPEPKLERLQKILAKAGISSRRKAEELILGGRVQINGKVVMELGTKADPARDHVRVDGKLLQGPERIRYFALNKPKGFVTTVSDPEGRPTVMQFFSGEHERLYPVGRLDYLSEGLLLVTNDGELANKLTKASSGVEKTYLVKVAGQPSEAGLDALRSGVVIEKGRGIGSGRVRTAPAQIRQVRQGDNPWYEVIVIEGRNRELRKMFEEIGHHVEKIRRIGYGPLILDLEPGKLRELEAEEVHSLRLASEGKLKTRRRRGPAAAQLPTVAGKTVRYKKADGKPGYEPRARTAPRPEFQTESKAEFKPEFRKIAKSSFKPKPSFQAGGKPEFRPEGKFEAKSEGRPGGKPAFKSGFKPGFKPEFKPGFKPDFKPGFKSGAKPAFGVGPSGGPQSRPGGRPEFGGRGNFPAKPRRPESRRVEPPVTDYVLPPRKSADYDREEETPRGPERSTGPRPTQSLRPALSKRDPAGGMPVGRRMHAEAPGESGGRPFNKPFRPEKPRPEFARPAEDDDFVPKKTPGFRIEPVIEKPREERPRSGGFSRPPQGGKPFRPAAGRPSTGDRPFRPRTDRTDRPTARPTDRPDRPFTGGKPFRPRTDRPDSRPDSRPGRPEGRGRNAPAPSGARPFRPRGEFGSGGARPGSRPGSNSGSRPASDERPARFGPRADGPPARGRKPFEGGAGSREDRPREFRPRPGGAPPRNFSGAKSGPPRPGAPRTGPAKTGPDGEPRKKERWRNSFTGKNKGRPKPKQAE
jgi:23S rRNA pseudouridine2605 synthase